MSEDADAAAEAVEQMQADAEAALQEGDVVAGIIQAGDLRAYLGTLQSLVAEAKLHLSSDGLNVSAVEPGNVAMFQECSLAARRFEHLEAPGQAVVGIAIPTLLDRLGPAADGDLVDLRLNMDTRRLELSYRTIEQSVALIDPDAIRSEPDDPDMELPNTVVVEGRQFAEAVEVADQLSGHLTITTDPDEREVRITAEGDTDSAAVAWADEDVIDADVSEQTVTKLSTEFLTDMVAPIPDAAEVTLRLGDEFPIRIKYDALEGAMHVHQMLAPRISSQ